jgi:60 kDa SS-A/Ro ribonucleoprotein
MDVFNANGKFDFIVYISDMQSWVNSNMSFGRVVSSTPLMASWELQKRGNKNAKLAEINVQSYGNTQADPHDKNILSVGGFSDSVFDVLAQFATRKDGVKFVDVVNSVEL